MINALYGVCEKFGWNEGRTFPLEKSFQKRDYLRRSYTMLLTPFSLFDNSGFNFLNMEWDYAIVLDACRYDTFKEVNDIVGVLHKKQSIASQTSEWVKKAIKRDYNDIIIITANVYLSNYKLRELTGKANRFYKNIPAWDIGWDDELETTPPWAMTEISQKMIKKFPNKRFIFWFLQPHHPFIGYSTPFLSDCREGVLENKKRTKTVWDAIMAGEIEISEGKNAYKKNLEIALKYVKKLIEYLDGKIVITADHGNCFGEMGLFEHPPRVHIPPLIGVPYLECEA